MTAADIPGAAAAAAARSLSVRGLHAGYGEVLVLRGVDIDVREAAITAVLGANGAGKSTLMQVLAGLIAPSAGQITLAGKPIGATPTHQRVASGIVLVPEGRKVFPELTVRENLMLGAVTPHARPGRDAMMAQVCTLFPRLQERMEQAGGTLSGGEQQMLALGRGLMARPNVLLLDEPTLGLAPAIARQIFRIVPRLRAMGITVLIAEQDLHRTLKIADHAYVLENGVVVAQGAGRDLERDPAVRRAYLGHD
ncbi:MAG: ABC transporter ATP-binding protein [Pararhodobacter sp.]|nr:ABC transporter ATP-binding protein [Pararhodobacter sp.]